MDMLSPLDVGEYSARWGFYPTQEFLLLGWCLAFKGFGRKRQ